MESSRSSSRNKFEDYLSTRFLRSAIEHSEIPKWIESRHQRFAALPEFEYLKKQAHGIPYYICAVSDGTYGDRKMYQLSVNHNEVTHIANDRRRAMDFMSIVEKIVSPGCCPNCINDVKEAVAQYHNRWRGYKFDETKEEWSSSLMFSEVPSISPQPATQSTVENTDMNNNNNYLEGIQKFSALAAAEFPAVKAALDANPGYSAFTMHGAYVGMVLNDALIVAGRNPVLDIAMRKVLDDKTLPLRAAYDSGESFDTLLSLYGYLRPDTPLHLSVVKWVELPVVDDSADLRAKWVATTESLVSSYPELAELRKRHPEYHIIRCIQTDGGEGPQYALLMHDEIFNRLHIPQVRSYYEQLIDGSMRGLTSTYEFNALRDFSRPRDLFINFAQPLFLVGTVKDLTATPGKVNEVDDPLANLPIGNTTVAGLDKRVREQLSSETVNGARVWAEEQIGLAVNNLWLFSVDGAWTNFNQRVLATLDKRVKVIPDVTERLLEAVSNLLYSHQPSDEVVTCMVNVFNSLHPIDDGSAAIKLAAMAKADPTP